MNYRDKICLCWDSGLFVSFALHLSKYFKKVYYHSDVHYGPFPKSSEIKIGMGLAENMERTDDPWGDVLLKYDKADLLIVFPDVYQPGGMMEAFRKQGYRVWGTAGATELELDRLFAKKLFKQIGINVGPYAEVKGLSALIEDIKEGEDMYVKARYGNIRGNFETFRTRNWDFISGRINREIRQALGESAESTEFLVEMPLEDCVELGGDFYTIDGQYPKRGCVGIERKAEAYVGRMMEWEDMPEQITGQLEKLAPYFKKTQNRNLFALESRIDKNGKAWAIDPCCRFSRPCSEVLQILYGNWPDILWQGAEGVCVDPEPTGKYAAQVMVYSTKAEKSGATITGKHGKPLPKDAMDWLKLVNHAIVDGKHEVLPGLSGIGAICAVGDTEAEAVKLCQERCELIDGDGVDSPSPTSVEKAAEEFKKLPSHKVFL